MARINLTAGRIRDFSTDKGQAFLWDADTPGLAVRATAPGKRNAEGGKAFIFQGKLATGPDVRLTIGDIHVWTLEAARAEARRLHTLLDQGIDPRIEKAERIATTKAKQAEAKRVAAPALEAWRAYLEARRPKWGERTYADHLRFADAGGKPKSRGRRPGEGTTTEPGALHELLSLTLKEIDAERITAWMKVEVAKRPTNTALAFRLLRAFLNWCASHPDYKSQVDEGICSTRSVRDEVPKQTAKEGDCLQREQLALWFGYVRRLRSPVISAYLQALLLTGARREEMAGLKWKNVDFQWRSLTTRDKKERERTFPLTPYLASLLIQLPRRNEWVFSSTRAASGRLREPTKGHNRAIIAAGLPKLTIHGLRRSFSTAAEWVEVPVGIVAQIQGHKPSAIAEKHYRRRPLDLLRMWHTKIEGWILEQAGIEQPKEDVRPELKVVTAA